MNWYLFVFTFLAVFSFQTGWAQTEVGPALPDLTLPAEVEIVEEQTEQVAAVPAPAPVKAKAAVSKKSSAKKTAATKKTAASNKKAAASATQQQSLPAPVVDAAPNAVVPEVTNAAAKVNNEEIVVENLMTQAEVAPAPAAQPDEWVGRPCPLCGKGTIIKGKTAYGCSEWRNGCTFRKPFDA